METYAQISQGKSANNLQKLPKITFNSFWRSALKVADSTVPLTESYCVLCMRNQFDDKHVPKAFFLI